MEPGDTTDLDLPRLKIASSLRHAAARALTATFRGLAVCLTLKVSLLDLKSDSASFHE